MKKLIILLALLTTTITFGQGAFLDMDTEQFGVYLRHEVKVYKEIHILAGIRHQKNLTRGDLMIGRYYKANDLKSLHPY